MHLSDFKLVFKLGVVQARQHPGRLVLTVASIMAAVCVIVWVTSGYDALIQKFEAFSNEYLGHYQVIVVPRFVKDATGFGHDEVRPLAPEVVRALRDDQAVAVADSVFQSRIRVQNPNSAADSPKLKSDDMPILVGTDAELPPYPLVSGKWITDQEAGVIAAAISADVAQRMQANLGDELIVASESGGPESVVRIVGIIEQVSSLPPMNLTAGLPSMRLTILRRGPADAALYVPTAAAERLTGQRAETSFVGLVLKSGNSADDWQASFDQRHPDIAGKVELLATTEIDQELSGSATSTSTRGQAYSATGISLLAALFIVFTTLSMGVHERTRQLAVLRAVALTKTQIGALVAIEGLMLGALGLIAGMAGGWTMLTLLRSFRPDFFPGGAMFGAWSLGLSVVCALGGSILAAILPAWRSMSIRPVEALSQPPYSIKPINHRYLLIVGVLFVVLNPIVTFLVPLPDAARYAAYAAIGCAGTAIGFILITPTFVILVERFLGPPIAHILRVNPRMLAGQLTANLGRTLGTTIALTLGLGIFVAMQTWGHSMLVPFMPGEWMPDALVEISPPGLTNSQVSRVAQQAGITLDQCLPLAVEQPKFAADLTGAQTRPSVTRQDNCIVIGVDPQRALGGEQPVLDFPFVACTRAESLARLSKGRYCLVPDHFRRESGLGVGDKLAVIPPHSPESVVEYEIAGIVAMNGWHLATKSGLRTRSGRSAALVIAPYELVRTDFGLNEIRFLWLNTHGPLADDALQASLQAAVDAAVAVDSPSDASDTLAQPRVRVQSTATLRHTIRTHAEAIIWGLSTLPLVTLVVASLGVVNTMLSSVRSRRWEFGVLRAVGVTRFGIVRLVLAEALLIGTVACLLSLGFGIVVGYGGTEVTRYVDVHGGLITPLTIPWRKLTPGLLVALLLCLFAAIGPAISIGRTEPLDLLKRG
jgi:putative ABC transport system permease protein